MQSFRRWINEVSIDRANWGYEISGTVEEVVKVLQRFPPDKKCDASVSFWSEEEYQRRFPDWAGKPRTEANIERSNWGWSIDGTVPEVIRLLQKCPKHKSCVAAVYNKGDLHSDDH